MKDLLVENIVVETGAGLQKATLYICLGNKLSLDSCKTIILNKSALT
jgi:hypothetical protein